MVDHIAIALEQNMQTPIAEAAAILGERPHAPAKAGIVRPGRLVSIVMRQQPMALHSRGSLIPKAFRRWATAFRLAAGGTINGMIRPVLLLIIGRSDQKRRVSWPIAICRDRRQSMESTLARTCSSRWPEL